MKWLALLLLLLVPFIALVKVGTWIERVMNLHERAEATFGRRLAWLTGPVALASFIFLPTLGLLYFAYSEVALARKLIYYERCPSYAGSFEKHYFCWFQWKYDSQVEDMMNRPLAKGELEAIQLARRRVDDKCERDSERISRLKELEAKIARDERQYAEARASASILSRLFYDDSLYPKLPPPEPLTGLALLRCQGVRLGERKTNAP
jgi:hypothetical protein